MPLASSEAALVARMQKLRKEIDTADAAGKKARRELGKLLHEAHNKHRIPKTELARHIRYSNTMIDYLIKISK